MAASTKTGDKSAAPKKPAAKSAAKPATKPAAKPAAEKLVKAGAPVVAKAAAKPDTSKAAKPKATAKGKSASVVLTAEQRRCYVEVAAYYMAERQGFAGDPLENWVQAEAEIERLLREGVLKP